MLTEYRPPDPAPGDELVVVVPGGQEWTIYGIQATFTASRDQDIVGQLAIDSSGAGRNGTYQGPTAHGGATGLVAGDPAVEFSTSGPPANVQGQMQYPASAYVKAGGVSCEFWCAMEVPAVETLLFDAETSNPSTLQVRVKPDGTLLFEYDRSGTGTETATSAAGVFQFGGAANYIVGVFKNSAARALILYHDGVQVATVALTLAVPGGISLGGLIGTASTTAPAVVYDEFAMYALELSAAQVLNHFVNASISYGAYFFGVLADTPRAYYRLNEEGSPTFSEVVLSLSDGNRELFVSPALGTIGDGTAHVYTWLTGIAAPATLGGTAQTFTGLPALVLPAGYTYTTDTFGDQFTFQWSNIVVWYDFVYDYGLPSVVDYDDIWLIPVL